MQRFNAKNCRAEKEERVAGFFKEKRTGREPSALKKIKKMIKVEILKSFLSVRFSGTLTRKVLQKRIYSLFRDGEGSKNQDCKAADVNRFRDGGGGSR